MDNLKLGCIVIPSWDKKHKYKVLEIGNFCGECKESLIYNNRIAKEYGDTGLKRAEINDFMNLPCLDDRECVEVNGFRYWKER